jgi:hypothetical protein
LAWSGKIKPGKGSERLLTIGRGKCSEHAPGQTTENLSNQQHCIINSEDYDEDETVESAQGENHYPSVSIFLRKVAVEKSTCKEKRNQYLNLRVGSLSFSTPHYRSM